jgi:hypothetical protein
MVATITIERCAHETIAQLSHRATISLYQTMAKIFISYRREDTKGITGRIFDRLERRFGKSTAFVDVETIRPGADVKEVIETELDQCRVVLVVMGPHWQGKRDRGAPRIFDERDFFRIEIERAIEKKIAIIPVLVDRTPMPTADQLPPALSPFTRLNGATLDSGRDFGVHINRLILEIEGHLGRRVTVGRNRLQIAATLTIVAVIGAGFAWWYWSDILAVRACNSEFTMACAQAGGVFGASGALAGLKGCRSSRIALSDDEALDWKDVWTTSVYSYAPGGGGPGGGLDNDELKVGGWGDWYFSLLQFNLVRCSQPLLFFQSWTSPHR